MKNIFALGMIVLLLSGCVTEKVFKARDPERAADLNAELGLGYMRQGRYKRAMNKLEKSLQYDSDNVKALHYKGELHRRLGQSEKAGEYFEQAIQLEPDNQLLLNNYGVYLCDIKKYDQAITLFSKSLEDPLYEYKARVYENIGLCRLWQGKINQSEAAFHQALAISPNMSTSLLELAKLSFDQGKKHDAHEYFNRYIGLAAHTPESLWLGILIEHGRGAKNAVASYKVKLKGRYPDSKETRLLKKFENQGKL